MSNDDIWVSRLVTARLEVCLDQAQALFRLSQELAEGPQKTTIIDIVESIRTVVVTCSRKNGDATKGKTNANH